MKNKLRAFGRSLLLDVGLRGKLLCIFFLLLVLPLGAFTLYAFHRINTVIEEQTYSAAQKAFEDTHTAVEDLLGRLTQVADILTMDPSLYALAASDPAGTSYIQRLEDRDRISTTFTYLRSMSGVDRVRLYVSNDYLYTNSADIVSLDTVRSSAWFSTFRNGRAVGWFGPADFADQPEGERDWYSLVRLVYDPSHVQQPLAILRVDIAAGRVDAAVSRSTITQNGTVLLLNGAEVLSSSSPERAAQLSGSLPADSAGWVDADTSQGPFRVQSVVLEDCGWTLAAALPRDDIFRASRQLRMEMLAVVVLLAAASYFLAYRLSQSITRRLYLLNDTMHAVELGDVSARVAPQGRDEIGQLMGSFSNMMGRIDTLMDEKLEQGQQIKALELKALQAQINPHFMLNAMNAVNYMALARGEDDIAATVDSIASLMRYSITEPDRLVTMSTELDNIREYIAVYVLRFRQDIRLEVLPGLDPAQVVIPKFTLQPLVENSIRHGITRQDPGIVIRIRAVETDGGVCVEVTDTGRGADAALLNDYLDYRQVDLKVTHGFGIRNVNERLQLRFGPGSHLRYTNYEGGRLLARLTLPGSGPA